MLKRITLFGCTLLGILFFNVIAILQFIKGLLAFILIQLQLQNDPHTRRPLQCSLCHVCIEKAATTASHCWVRTSAHLNLDKSISHWEAILITVTIICSSVWYNHVIRSFNTYIISAVAHEGEMWRSGTKQIISGSQTSVMETHLVGV